MGLGFRVGGLSVVAVLLSTASPAWAQAIDAQEAAELRAQIASLKAQIDRLESRLGPVEAATAPTGVNAPVVAAAAPAPDVRPKASDTRISWKGSPLLSQGGASFKMRGRIQYDAGLLNAPAGVVDKATGYSNELRRLRLGAEGQLGGDFGYKLEAELSDNAVEVVDTYISYEKGKWLVLLGNQNQFQSLDELISDSAGSVMERAAFTDAFGFERRLGLSVQYSSGPWLAQAGIFSDSVDSLTNDKEGDKNNSYGFDGRLVFAPKLGETQLHFGASGHWRDFQKLSNEPQRYRQRPFLHTVNTRFLATPSISATGESHYGVELAGIRGPLWWAGEAHWLKVARPDRADPSFFGGYGEVGFVFTGESRGYKNGIMGIVRPDRPVGSGGWGALQATVRYDYLDLNDKDVVGGTQNGVIAALVWTPIEYLRFNVNYARLNYTNAAVLNGGQSNYGVNVVGWRAELDF